MNSLKKHWQLLLIVFLLITNLATIGSIVYHKQRFAQNKLNEQPYWDNHGWGRQDKQGKQDKDSPLDRMMMKHLQPDEQQQVLFREYRSQFNDSVRNIMQQMHRHRGQFLLLLAAEPMDSVKLQQSADEFGLLHRQIKLETIRLYRNMATRCSPPQRAQLDTVFARLVDNPNWRKGPKRFRQQGNH